MVDSDNYVDHSKYDSEQLYLERLKERVNVAFSRRVVTDLFPVGDGLYSSPEEVEDAEAIISCIQNNSPNIVGTLSNQNCVTVNTIERYQHLLQIAYCLLFPYIDPEELQARIADDIRHEREHAVVFDGNPDAIIRYGVRFYEDRITKRYGFGPFVRLIERNPLDRDDIIKFHTNPTDPSYTDKMKLEGLRNINTSTAGV